MALDSKHPAYNAMMSFWALLQDCYAGEQVIKSKDATYLPPTQSQIIDGYGKNIQRADNIGQLNYEAYKLRAQFPDYVKDAVEMAIGLMHQEDAVIELPEAMESMRDSATLQGESLLNVLRRINEAQLTSGRVGILGDLPSSPDPTAPMPYIALYNPLTVFNWDINSQDDNNDQLNLVVLCESGQERQENLEWKEIEKFRVLMLSSSADVQEVASVVNNPGSIEPSQTQVYLVGMFVDTKTFNPQNMDAPMIRGTTLDEIPFVFCNVKDIVTNPDFPPLLGLANLSVSIYRSEADYRQALFMQGQDTLVTIGSLLNEDGAEVDSSQGTRTGAGAVISVDIGGDAKYIGVDSAGLPEQRMALENDRALAATKTVQVRGNSESDAESGRSRKIRIAAETANLNQIAMTGAAALEKELKILAKWMGANPDQVSVTPNLDFTMEDLDSRSLVELMTAKNMGAPLSMESIHKIAMERGLTELEFEAEKALYEKELEEMAARIPQGTDVGGNPEDDLDNSGDEE